MNLGNPESILQQSKKGRTVMSFVAVSGQPERTEAEEITKLWQSSLWNNQIQAEKYVKPAVWESMLNRFINDWLLFIFIFSCLKLDRYMIDDNRAIFMFKDGSQAWAAKDYLTEQDRCESVTIENKAYPGKGSADYKKKEEL